MRLGTFRKDWRSHQHHQSRKSLARTDSLSLRHLEWTRRTNRQPPWKWQYVAEAEPKKGKGAAASEVSVHFRKEDFATVELDKIKAQEEAAEENQLPLETTSTV
jgi:hypothetical protein